MVRKTLQPWSLLKSVQVLDEVKNVKWSRALTFLLTSNVLPACAADSAPPKPPAPCNTPLLVITCSELSTTQATISKTIFFSFSLQFHFISQAIISFTLQGQITDDLCRSLSMINGNCCVCVLELKITSRSAETTMTQANIRWP